MPEPGDPQALNRYSYALNNPLKYRDPTGHWVETLWDIANIGWDIAEVKRDPSLLNWGALVVDVAALVVPVMPGGAGLIARGGKAAKAVAEVATHADEAADVAKAVSKIENVRHARSSAGVVQSVLTKIDPARFNPASRFGKALYVAQKGKTAVAEIAVHGAEASHVIRYQVDLSKAKVLDLTNADIAKAWGYVEDASAYGAHQDLARRAMEQGYNTIKYHSLDFGHFCLGVLLRKQTWTELGACRALKPT